MIFAPGHAFSAKQALEAAQNFLELQNAPENIAAAEILLSYYLNITRPFLKVNAADNVSAAVLELFEAALIKYANGQPLAYVTGCAQFLDFTLAVNPSVLIPRPETEEMVFHAFKLIKNMPANLRVLDLCTGSGAIAIAIKRKFPKAETLACDISEKAVETACLNAGKLAGGKIEIIASDLFSGINGSFDIIISNPPYINAVDMAGLGRYVLEEPALALSGGGDGLDIIRKIIACAPGFLKPDGFLIMEHGAGQFEKIKGLLSKNFRPESFNDYQGFDRYFTAQYNKIRENK